MSYFSNSSGRLLERMFLGCVYCGLLRFFGISSMVLLGLQDRVMSSSWNGAGSMVTTLSKPISGDFPAEVRELLALREGLLIIKKCNLVVIYVEVDAANIPSGLNGDDFQWSAIGPIFNDIKVLLGDVGVVYCMYILRSRNTIAHTLAALALFSK
ncbi:hypothetical protein ACOSQ4_019838 [Xanthoceras sorbifolium]